MEYKHYRTCVCNINYHLIFSTKYRKKVLRGEVEQTLKQLFKEISEDKGFEIVSMEIGGNDHIHMFIKAHPKYAIGQIVKWIKGISGNLIFVKHPELRKELWKGKIWTHGYFVETIGSTSEENIKKYIENQKKE